MSFLKKAYDALKKAKENKPNETTKEAVNYMQPYPTYKDSGVEWIEEIPEHWIISKIKFKYEISRVRVIANTDLIEDGIYPVYSSQMKNNGYLGHIDYYDFEGKYITWTTDGANSGAVFQRFEEMNR